MLITLYARKEPTQDPVLKAHGLGRRRDTVIYSDAACTKPKARFSALGSQCPRTGTTRVTINCFKWRLKWV